MTIESSRRVTGHTKSVVVTGLTAVAGVGAGLAADLLDLAPGSNTALGIMLVAIVVQFPILSVGGVDVDDFSTKDYLYVAFMTFSLWFVTWSILLTTQFHPA